MGSYEKDVYETARLFLKVFSASDLNINIWGHWVYSIWNSLEQSPCGLKHVYEIWALGR